MTEKTTMEPKFGTLYLGCVGYAGADIRIGHRGDALDLLDELIEAESVKDIDVPLPPSETP
ncbi:MAG: hypothetical protein LBB89_03815 [Treponema sp.]|nr:hypothetical protein [Treponema sp.]